MANTISEARIPFTKMTFSPDVPSTALSPNEYNAGLNVETDVRGIRSVAGDQEILTTIPGTPTFVTGGFRRNGQFWFIVATVEGYWYASNGDDVDWYNITPNGGPISGYAQNTNITEAWNGTVVFFNDTLNPPMFLPDADDAILIMYSNQNPLVISNITAPTLTTRTATFTVAQTAAPFQTGAPIIVSGVNPSSYDGEYIVTGCTTTDVTFTCPIVAAYVAGGQVAPKYVWNYYPNWKSYYANFMRIYNTPNVGSILVAGDLTVTDINDVVTNYPVTVQWSQAFGLNEAPITWEPTITNVANQLEVPLRGPAIDGFPSNGQFFLCSYWDTVVFSPINYSTTATPILGVRIFNQGRGLLSSNTWGNTDKLVYGVDARDIWVFDGSDFTGIGNQRVKNWFYDQLDPKYYDRVFMEVNTQKNQIEIYYPDSSATTGVPNKMISYRYDLDIWNAPRDVSSATFSCESPVWTANVANLSSRTVVYARGVTDQKLVQKDRGFSFINDAPISSLFRRDNIKIIDNYSGKILVHRILPEVVNLKNDNLPLYPSTGNITVTIEGANSVGQEPTSKPSVTMEINTDNPWCQIDQNSSRVNTLELSNSSNVAIWMCSATTWQFTQVEDDR